MPSKRTDNPKEIHKLIDKINENGDFRVEPKPEIPEAEVKSSKEGVKARFKRFLNVIENKLLKL